MNGWWRLVGQKPLTSYSPFSSNQQQPVIRSKSDYNCPITTISGYLRTALELGGVADETDNVDELMTRYKSGQKVPYSVSDKSRLVDGGGQVQTSRNFSLLCSSA